MQSFFIKAVALTTLSASMNVSAQSAIEALGVESIKATHLPHYNSIEARREIAKSQIEQEYKQTARALGL
ncbi:TPA: hypothetical protein NG573_004281 [Vibrio parahaemolyticus]|uniref:hypothetical protein n=1 Tax=Vibrio parahaemolyticus TaxID=670 RepID=UPI001E5AA43B|nr:hypothetical protein [Vibrio parahaemolyticus]HCE2128179.1 hypothetical protein [Vibrio parahaemolyticus]HCE3220886.1 hypothetical protein [Vibrio parahaemolyticus]HCM1038594.1 hypothetical protein [Vibrio parahaemolyticus]